MRSDYETDADAQSDGISTLPAAARELYQTLTREGTAWRGTATPEIERVNQRLTAQIALLSAGRPADDAPITRRIEQPLVTVSAPGGYVAREPQRPTGAPHVRASGPRRWITT